MISQEKFNEIEELHGCGYWNICIDARSGCPCAISTEHKGLQEKIWNSLIRERDEEGGY